MENLGLLARVVAKPGKENAVQDFITNAVALAKKEEKTLAWYAIKISDNTFGVFDTFTDEVGREAHLTGKIATALMENAPELLATAPVIEKIDVLAAK